MPHLAKRFVTGQETMDRLAIYPTPQPEKHDIYTDCDRTAQKSV